TMSSISRNDMSGLTPGTSYVSNLPETSGPGWRHTVSVMRIAALLIEDPLLVGTRRRVDEFEVQRLLVELGFVADTLPLPGRDVRVVLVVAQRLAVGRLVLLAEVPAAALVAPERVEHHQLAELEEVGDPPGLLQRLVAALVLAEHADVLPELVADRRDL